MWQLCQRFQSVLRVFVPVVMQGGGFLGVKHTGRAKGSNFALFGGIV